VSAARAAQILDVTEAYVRKLIADGRLPGSALYKPPGRARAFWKIPLDSLAAHIESRKNV
jgi:hypothetical protein